MPWPASSTLHRRPPFHFLLPLQETSMPAAAVAVFSSGVGGGALIPAAPAARLPFKRSAVSWPLTGVSNGSRIHCMQTWSPTNNKKFEALSYLPPLSDESIAKEIDYMIANGWIPCLEFDEVGHVHRSNCRIPGYYDGRYWTMWKLPMFGCTDASQVFEEIRQCREAYPGAFVRLLAFDNERQCQCISFVIQKPQ